MSQTIITRRALDATLLDSRAEAYRLTPACHPTAGVDLIYAGEGLVLVWCHRCHDDVATLAVGEAPPTAGHAAPTVGSTEKH